MYQKVRKILFLSSVVLFLFLLPGILLFTFGFKIDWENFRVLKTGLIWINSLPEGASVYLNGKFLDKKTPATIDELLPGRYAIGLLLPGYYSWQSDVDVYSGKVASITNIILFPRLPQFEKLSFEETNKFFIFNHDKNFLYYVIKGSKRIHKINFESGRFESVLRADFFLGEIENISLSIDKEKLLMFDKHNIGVIYLSKDSRKKNFNLYCKDNILQIFWHSDSEHFIVITNRDIKVYELFSQGSHNTAIITKLSGKPHSAYYDEATDTLIFLEQQEASDGRRYENIYKIVVGSRFRFPFLKGFKK